MTIYHKQNPFISAIKERYSLCKPGSDKNIQHITLDLRGSGLQYQVGDSIGIFPTHDPVVVARTLAAMHATGNESVQLKSNNNESFSLLECLTRRCSLTAVSPKLLKEVALRQPNAEKRQHLEHLLEDAHYHEMKAYLEKHELWDFLLAHQEVHWTAQELVDLLMPMLPRFYSISSSQKYVGDEVHLTVATVSYESNGHQRQGVCTHYLCELAQMEQQEVPVFIQPAHDFRLPEHHDTPLIMIGPGTGVAPFRAFMQERVFHGSQGKHWLFFGERSRHHNFLYEDEWSHFQTKGHLRVDLAFSRDQDNKVYVQDRMRESSSELFQWLQNGAHLYVCGDAKRMAKDVDATLLGIIQEQGALDAGGAKEYVKKLRQQKRYLRDVY